MLLTSKTQKRLFIFGSFIVLLLAVLLYTRINALVDSYYWVDHTNKVELKLERTVSYLKDAETGQSAFLFSRDSSFLQPYIGVQQRVDSMLAEVNELVKYNPAQQQNLILLQSLIDRRFASLNNLLPSAYSSDTLGFHLETGRIFTNRIRRQIELMQGSERDLLEKRESLKDYYVKLTPLSLLFLVFSMLAIIGFSYYGLTKQLQQMEKYATDLDYLNHELLLKNKQLENSVEELNSFNYIASHDLKEPLRKILFFTDSISNQDKVFSEKGMAYLDKIRAAGERMKSLLDDLLTYTQASMMEHKKETVDLNALLHTVVESLSDSIIEKGAKVTFRNLPQVHAVASQMQQLFENLISNALKYSREAEPPVIGIQSSTASKRDVPPSFEAVHDYYHCIVISDNGIGFTQENAEKIFVLFQRLHQRHEFAGTGIGLTICRKIVQNHNGFIMAESEVDKGTSFTVYLPE